MAQMEIPNVPKTALNKPEDTGRVDANRQKRVTTADAPQAQTDGVSLSSKAKLMGSLRSGLDKLDAEAQQKVQDLKERVQQGSYKLSSEEIVGAILKGSLFSVV
jgi:flagellar biosynthesis anti-sigma factor FlgM